MKMIDTIQVHPIEDTNVDRPLWSVMIPAHNSLPYLKETIESVLAQDEGVENMEIWVVDDCSAENPQAIVEELGKGRIGFYRQKQNVGQLGNFSTCLNLSKGKLIHLLHGDDYVHNGFYESLGKALMSENNTGAAFTACNMVAEDGTLIIRSDLLANNAGIINDFLSIITRKQVIQTPSIVVKREVYEKLGAFNTTLTWAEDWEMWIRIACNYNFYYQPLFLASYRLHSRTNTEDSIRTGRFIKDVLNCINVYAAYLKMPYRNKKQIINSAKQHYLTFAGYQSHKRVSLAILFRSFPLVYNFSSFCSILYQIVKISIKKFIRKIRTNVRSKH